MSEWEKGISSQRKRTHTDVREQGTSKTVSNAGAQGCPGARQERRVDASPGVL